MKKNLIGFGLLATATLALSSCSILNLLSKLRTDNLMSVEEIRAKLGDEYCYTLEAYSHSSSDEEGAEDAEPAKYTYAQTSEHLMYVNGEDNFLVKKGSDTTNAVIYTYDVEQDAYNSMLVYDISGFVNEADTFLTLSRETIVYTKKEKCTYLGRECTKYIIDADVSFAGDGLQANTETIIDKKTGATLSFQIDATLNSKEEGKEDGQISFKVTSFNQGDNVAKAKINEQVAKINVKEWDTAIMSEVGLSSLTKIDGKFYFASVSETEYGTAFTFTKGAEEAKKYMKAIYDAGAKYDSDGETKAFEDLYIEHDEFTISFAGYTKVNGETKSITAEYNSPEDAIDPVLGIRVSR